MIETRIAARRRYGTTTYTWVEAYIDGEWESLGDPWPAVTPKKSEVEAAALALAKSFTMDGERS